MPTIFIDNRPYQIDDEGKNLLEVCLSLGINLPFFCWHPALHAVGACRQCAVKLYKNEQDTHGRIAMACMTPAKDGMRLSVDDPEAVAFRAGVIEWLMVNHPHDCPVCDEGGECHLQDMTLMTGHVYRRMRFTKRTYRNQELGPFVKHEMNRCIQCYRCVRFYRDFAGGRDFGVFGAHEHVYFGRHEEGTLESEFSGNLVEVCPTGVFTDKTLWRHYTRKWDLQTAPSICVHCGLGCNTIPGERYGMLRRIRNRYHGDVNGYFLCDRGRFGYEFVNSDQRIVTPLLGTGEARQAVTRAAALAHLAGVLHAGRIIGISSPRASLETNFALRTLVGADRCYPGVSPRHHALLRAVLAILRDGPSRTPTQQEAARADAVFVLGEDVSNTAPMLALALRQAAWQAPREQVPPALGIPPFDDAPAREAIQQERSPFFIATPLATRLDDVATATYRAAPDDLARLGFAVAHALDPAAPPVAGLSVEMQALAQQIAAALKTAKRPLVISGTGCESLAVVQAAANTAWALGQGLCYTAPTCNSLGLVMQDGGDIDDAVEALRRGEADTVVVAEADLYQQFGAATTEAIFTHARQVIVLDSLHHATTERADVVLPAAAFAEADGTLVNSEGRAQRFFQVFTPPEDIQESWRWLDAMIAVAGGTETPRWQNLDAVLTALAAELPELAAAAEAAPSASFRLIGQKIPRQTPRYSGRTAITANLDVHEPPPPPDQDAPLNFSMEGYANQPPPALIPRFWAPGWNSVQSVNQFQQEVGGPLRGGNPGMRLIEPSPGAARYFIQVPAAFVPRPGVWLLLPAYHVFGSEELSLRSPGIAERAPAPYLAINTADAARLHLVDGETAIIREGTQQVEGIVRLRPDLPTGVVALPVGLPATRGIDLPAWVTLTPVGAEETP